MTDRTRDASRRQRVWVLALLAALCLCPAEAWRGDEVTALVDRCIEAYGGAENLRAVAGWQQIGRIVSPMRGEGVMARVFVPPDRLRVETRFSDQQVEIRILNGEQGWRSGRPVEGPPHVAMVLQAARLSLPLILLEGKDHVRDLGESEESGRSVRRLRLDLRDDMHLEIEIDVESARIDRSRSVAGPFVFETAYEDFRQVDGVVFPFVETTSAMGHETGRYEMDRVVLDGEIRDRVFVP